jgi:DNA-binding NtrC family response regulator
MLPTHLVRSILVVDSDGALLEASVPVLVERGYRVHHASDADGALWILRRTAIDLLIVDNCAIDVHGLLHAKSRDPDLADIRVVLVTVGALDMAPLHGLVHEAVMPATH